jgi:hypothetical protein
MHLYSESTWKIPQNGSNGTVKENLQATCHYYWQYTGFHLVYQQKLLCVPQKVYFLPKAQLLHALGYPKSVTVFLYKSLWISTYFSYWVMDFSSSIIHLGLQWKVGKKHFFFTSRDGKNYEWWRPRVVFGVLTSENNVFALLKQAQ